MDKAKLSWAIGIIGGLIAIGTTGKTFWHDWGWITPAMAEAEHIAGAEAIKEFRDEWKCDEYEEELQELKRQLVRAEPGTDVYADIEHKISRIENKMLKLECSRFEDFG